jgi:hypothetical protein
MKELKKAADLSAPEFKTDGLFTFVFQMNVPEKSSEKSSKTNPDLGRRSISRLRFTD